ncbi:MAG: rod shape-determining protein RodA [Flavobacteriaceae bacterium]|nr:rod shape-determining protein RodA [Flavobacteriaceae bacterium]
MNRSLRLDWITIVIYLALVCFGITNIYSSTFDENQPELFNLSRSIGKQLVFFGVSIASAIFILAAPSKVFERFSSIIYLATILLLIGLYPFGNTISGARSWYAFGGVSLQPAEFAKVAVALAIAKLISEIQIDLRKFNSLLQVVLVIALPMGLILLQPDAGSALVFGSFIFVLFREGLKPVYLLLIAAMLFFFILTLVAPLPFVYVSILTVVISLYFFSKKVNKKSVIYPYLIAIFISIGYVYSVDYIFNDIFEQRHRDRINIVLGKEVDTQGIGYNLNQSKIAIGSGGWEGKGFLQGTQTKGGFVPEQHTDYIFSTIGEEWGFKGTAAVVLLFSFLILRILSRAEAQKNNFSRIYAYSVASILFVHFLINIGMSIGLVPTIGIPLPLISYGGSSLLAFTVLIAIYLNLDANRLNEASF